MMDEQVVMMDEEVDEVAEEVDEVAEDPEYEYDSEDDDQQVYVKPYADAERRARTKMLLQATLNPLPVPALDPAPEDEPMAPLLERNDKGPSSDHDAELALTYAMMSDEDENLESDLDRAIALSMMDGDESLLAEPPRRPA